MKRILVIEREYGAGGSVIAEMAAQRLGWKLLDNELTERIAATGQGQPRSLQAPRRARGSRGFTGWPRSSGAEATSAASGCPMPAIVDADHLICLSQKVIEEAAKAGQCVIVGGRRPISCATARTRFAFFSMPRATSNTGVSWRK